MHEGALKTARIVSVVAATFISLACGTNYAYSAWGPQFADRMQLSATQSNLIGVAGNIGMYASGIPVGLLVDSRGPKPAVFLGAIALGAGYFPLRKAFDDGPGSMNVPLLMFLAYLTGLGSCSAFSASIKVCAQNWPQHRGTATAFPLSGFGLSAFAFTMISGFAFPDNTSSYLLLLAIGTFSLVFVSMFFLRVLPPQPTYSTLPNEEDRPPFVRKDSNELHRTRSGQRRYSGHSMDYEPNSLPSDADERSSLVSKSSSGPGDLSGPEEVANQDRRSHKPDIIGIALLPKPEFWQLFVMLGLLTGVGLMTINNIGNDAKALWSHYDDTASKDFIQKRQLMHVSILSFTSFCGRLLSGVGSDVVVKRLHGSRFWCLFASASIFLAAQICALRIENPNFLWFVSGLTGLAYGALFGVYPALVADAFGVEGLSLNWGCMILSPVLFGNIFNLTYGKIYDHHSTILPGGERDCPDGLNCYARSYWVTGAASVLGIGLSLWAIRHEHVQKRLERRAEHEGLREA